MTNVVRLTFNPFQENTYVVYDDTSEAVIIDPGCWDEAERTELRRTIDRLQLHPVRLLNTHCHLDHIYGNRFVADTYGLPLEIHERELRVLQLAAQSAMLFGAPPPDPSPEPQLTLHPGSTLTFGRTSLEVLFTPGHSPGSISFYCRESTFLIAGDVLFQGSIGRTDLPGGDYDTLIGSILSQFMPLPDETAVYPGHGPQTTIGAERRTNPFLK